VVVFGVVIAYPQCRDRDHDYDNDNDNDNDNERDPVAELLLR